MQRFKRSVFANSRALNVLFVMFAGAICAALLLHPTLGALRPASASPITPSRQLIILEEQVTASPVLSGFVSKVETPLVAGGRVWPSTCITYVNVEYRYVFVKQFKTGSTTLRRLFTECTGDTAADAPWCLSGLGPVNAAVKANWSEYTVLTTVRNPYTRAISNYNYLLEKMANDSQCRAVTWDKYCVDPYSVSELCKLHPECAVARSQAEMAAHVHRQAMCMVDRAGGWTVDFIIRTENMETDLAAAVEEINGRRRAGLPPIVLKPMTVKNPTDVCGDPAQNTYAVNGTEVILQTPRERYCNASQYYGEAHQHCKSAVEAHYSEDFNLLF